MTYPEGTPERGLQKLAVKYGGAAAIIIVNVTVIQVMLIMVVYAVLGFVPDGSGLLDTGTDAGFLFMLILNEIASYTVPLITLYALFYRELRFEKTIREPPGLQYNRFFGETALLYVGGMFSASVLGTATNYVSELLNRLLGIPETKTAFSSMMPYNLFTYAVFEVVLCIVGPVCEEIIFRHLLLRPLRRYGDITAAFVTALLFGLSHFNFDQFLYTFAFGFFLAVITLRSGSIIPAILCHMLNNFAAGIEVYLPESFGDTTLDSIFSSLSDVVSLCETIMFYAGIPALILVIITHLLRLKNRSGIPESKQSAIVLSNPLMLVSLVIGLVVTFANLYLV